MFVVGESRQSRSNHYVNGRRSNRWYRIGNYVEQSLLGRIEGKLSGEFSSAAATHCWLLNRIELIKITRRSFRLDIS